MWKPFQGIIISNLEAGRVLFQFYHVVDYQIVLKGGPGSFDRNMLILGVIKEGDDPKIVSIFCIPFLVQIHNLPMGFMSQMVGESIGNFIDQYLDYDEKNNVNYLRSFMRIGVLMDVQKPFMKSKIKKPGGEFKEFCYKYEYLGPFCYFYGILGHTENHCRTLLFMQQDDGKCGLGPKIQVEACPNDGAVDHVTYGTPEILNRGNFRQKRRQQMLTIKCNDNAFNANDKVDKKLLQFMTIVFRNFKLNAPIMMKPGYVHNYSQ